MASTLLNEQGFPPDVIELQLAHSVTGWHDFNIYAAGETLVGRLQWTGSSRRSLPLRAHCGHCQDNTQRRQPQDC
jgi:hypothetical protein